MNIAVVIVTHNRLQYTQKTLSRILDESNDGCDLYLWDNNSTDQTGEYLSSVKDPRVVEVILSKENLGQTGAMNYVWSKTKAELVGKLDNDCLVTPGWTEILARAHHNIPRLGAVACWHFPKADFNLEAASRARKIQTFGSCQIFRHPWVCGSGFLMKRETFKKYGPWQTGPCVGTTYYFLRMALGGEINGWHWPLVLQEHMDDPVSEYTMLTDDNSIAVMRDVTFSLKYHRIKTLNDRMSFRKAVIDNLFNSPWQAEYYVGWRAKFGCGAARIARAVRTAFEGIHT